MRCKACDFELAAKYMTSDGLCVWCEAERAEDYERYLHLDLRPDGMPKVPLPRPDEDPGYGPQVGQAVRWDKPSPLIFYVEKVLYYDFDSEAWTVQASGMKALVIRDPAGETPWMRVLPRPWPDRWDWPDPPTGSREEKLQEEARWGDGPDSDPEDDDGA